MKRPLFISLVALFASFNVICDSLMGFPELSSGVWQGWIFIAEPVSGIVLGPYAGFLSTLIGVMIGHSIYFRDMYEFLFTLGAPLGAMVSGFLFRGRWKAVLAYYTLLLGIYFITPIAWRLPAFGMWNVYLAYSVLLVLMIIIRKGTWNPTSKGLPYVLGLSALIGLEADILFRIIIFIPGQTYRLFYNLSVEELTPMWLGAAVITPIKVAISILVTVTIGPALMRTIRKIRILKEDDTASC